MTGYSWEDVERLCADEDSETTVCDRRDEWITAGVYDAIVYDAIVTEALAGYDKIVGLVLDDVAVTGSLHEAGTQTERRLTGSLGWRWRSSSSSPPSSSIGETAVHRPRFLSTEPLEGGALSRTEWR